MMQMHSNTLKYTTILEDSLLKMTTTMDHGWNGCGLILHMAAPSGVFHLLSNPVEVFWFES